MQKILYSVCIIILGGSCSAFSEEAFESALEKAETLSEVCYIAYEIFDRPMELALGVSDPESLEAASRSLDELVKTLPRLAKRLQDFSDLSDEVRRSEFAKIELDLSERRELGRALKSHLREMDPALKEEWLRRISEFSKVFRSYDPVFRKYLK